VKLRAILTDLEGTTTALAFVKETLFPYASEHLADFVARHPQSSAVLEACAAARQGSPESAPVETLRAWIRADRKIGVLKTLQGRIWREGYMQGALRGHLWPDAVVGLQRMAASGLRLAVFSSGSVEAQQLLFRHSVAGDLSGLIEAWFDTSTGPKQAASSYASIAASLGIAPQAILFLSDSPPELDAARDAGLRTCCIERGEAGDPPPHDHPRAADFTPLPLDK
jgi:enolase-phosphatase E1